MKLDKKNVRNTVIIRRILIILLCIFVIVFLTYLHVAHLSIPLPESNNNISYNNNLNIENNKNKNIYNYTNQTSGTTSIDISNINNNNNNENNTYKEDLNINENNNINNNIAENMILAPEVRKSGISTSSSITIQKTEQYMANKDIQSIDRNATEFIKRFYTYEQQKLANDSWRNDCLHYINVNDMLQYPDNIVYTRLITSDWSTYVSKHSSFYASVDSVEINNTYATTEVNDPGDSSTMHPVVDLTIVYNVTDGEPGDTPWWDRLTKQRANFLVHLNDNNQITHISCIKTDYIETIRDSKWSGNSN